MPRTLNADEFAQQVFKWQGKDYKFFPASIKELIEYYEGDLATKLAEVQGDRVKVLELHKESITRRVPELTPEVIDTLPEVAFWRLVNMVRYGESEDTSKNL